MLLISLTTVLFIVTFSGIFPVIHKVGNIDIFVLLRFFKNNLGMVISHIYFLSKDHVKCKFTLKVIQFLMIPIFISIRKTYKNITIANFVYYGKTRFRFSLKLSRTTSIIGRFIYIYKEIKVFFSVRISISLAEQYKIYSLFLSLNLQLKIHFYRDF